MGTRINLVRRIAALGILPLAGVACGNAKTATGADAGTDGAGADRPADVTPADGSEGGSEAGGRALLGGNPDFTPGVMVGEGYWYSRYEMSTLAMMSGMGEMVDPSSPTDPFAKMIGQAMRPMIDMANDCPSSMPSCVPPNDPTTGMPMPQVPAPSMVMDTLHPALVTRIFNSGDPSLANVFNAANPMDTLNMRFVPSGSAAAKTLTGAYAWLAVKEMEWARQFHVDSHFGAPGPDDKKPLAMIRFFGEVIFAEAMMQTNVLLDDTVDMSTMPPTIKTPAKFDWSNPQGNYAVLISLADLVRMLTGDPAKGNVLCTADKVCSASNRYRMMGDLTAQMMLGAGKKADDLAGMFLMAANMLIGTPMIPEPPPDLRSAAVAVQAMVWLAAAEQDAAMRDKVKARLRGAADAVLAAPRASSVDQAATLLALVEASRVLGDTKYKGGAAAAWKALSEKYDPKHGVWTDVAAYDGDDLAFLYGGLFAFGSFGAGKIGSPAADANRALAMLMDAFEGIMDIGGFQVAAPPAMPPFIPPAEHMSGDLFHRYPSMPMPSMVTPSAKGNGVAPMCAKSVAWDGSKWTVDRSVVETAPCMHLANQMLWFHIDEVNGFPDVP